MKLLRILSALLAIGAMVSCQSKNSRAPEANNMAEHDSIRTFLTNYYDAMSRRSWSEYKGFFWEKATLTTVWQPRGLTEPAVVVVTIDDFIRQTPEGPDSKPIFEEKMTAPPEVRVEGNLASAWARYNAKFGAEDDLTEWNGTDVFTLMKHNGEWKIVSLAYE